MTKKDYELIARAISISKSNININEESRQDIAQELAEQLGRENRIFNRVKFYKACRIEL